MSENMTMAELLAAEESKKPKRGDIVKAKVEVGLNGLTSKWTK